MLSDLFVILSKAKDLMSVSKKDSSDFVLRTTEPDSSDFALLSDRDSAKI
jgi:hypothetical protein